MVGYLSLHLTLYVLISLFHSHFFLLPVGTRTHHDVIGVKPSHDNAMALSLYHGAQHDNRLAIMRQWNFYLKTRPLFIFVNFTDIKENGMFLSKNLFPPLSTPNHSRSLETTILITHIIISA